MNESIQKKLNLFDAIGIELEYMIVDQTTLNIQPVADRLLANAKGNIENEIPAGELARSNELAAHVIELKNPVPESNPYRLGKLFHNEITNINKILSKSNCTMLPGPVHPWMNPEKETKLWPHGDDTIYRTYDRIFGCKGHGWSNLQSMHINLPFGDDQEFGRLHAAIRLTLPLIPALASASPFLDGKSTEFMDSRLHVYEKNQKRIPAITGGIIPGPFFSRNDYEKKILNRIYKRIKPLDPEGILQEEWINSRGAIARFDRNAIEIRVTDIQENPFVDIEIASLITGLVRHFVEEKTLSYRSQKLISTELLRRHYRLTVKDGSSAFFTDPTFLKIYSKRSGGRKAGNLWLELAPDLEGFAGNPVGHKFLDIYAKEGDLAHRMISFAGLHPSRKSLTDLLHRFIESLQSGIPFSNFNS